MTATANATRPDLTGQSTGNRMRVLVEETQGAAWIKTDGMLSWQLFSSTMKQLAVIWREGGNLVWRGPDPLADPAAWGALEEREGIATWRARAPDGDDLVWYAAYPDKVQFDPYGPGPETLIEGAWYFHPKRGYASSFAVLAKHGIPWPA